MASNKDCVLGGICIGSMVAFSMALITPEHPEKPFIEEATALRADNVMLQEKMTAFLNEQIQAEKKRTQEALSQCKK